MSRISALVALSKVVKDLRSRIFIPIATIIYIYAFHNADINRGQLDTPETSSDPCDYSGHEETGDIMISVGSDPDASAVAIAIANAPQSADPTC